MKASVLVRQIVAQAVIVPRQIEATCSVTPTSMPTCSTVVGDNPMEQTVVRLTQRRARQLARSVGPAWRYLAPHDADLQHRPQVASTKAGRLRTARSLASSAPSCEMAELKAPSPLGEALPATHPALSLEVPQPPMTSSPPDTPRLGMKHAADPLIQFLQDNKDEGPMFVATLTSLRRSCLHRDELTEALAHSVRLCFHRLVRSRAMTAALSFYWRLLDLGVSLRQSDVVMLLGNLPYDKSAGSVAEATTDDWMRNQTEDLRPRRRLRAAPSHAPSPMSTTATDEAATIVGAEGLETSAARSGSALSARAVQRLTAYEASMGNVSVEEWEHLNDLPQSCAAASDSAVNRVARHGGANARSHGAWLDTVSCAALLQHLVLLQQLQCNSKATSTTGLWKESLHLLASHVTASAHQAAGSRNATTLLQTPIAWLAHASLLLAPAEGAILTSRKHHAKGLPLMSLLTQCRMEQTIEHELSILASWQAFYLQRQLSQSAAPLASLTREKVIRPLLQVTRQRLCGNSDPSHVDGSRVEVRQALATLIDHCDLRIKVMREAHHCVNMDDVGSELRRRDLAPQAVRCMELLAEAANSAFVAVFEGRDQRFRFEVPRNPNAAVASDEANVHPQKSESTAPGTASGLLGHERRVLTLQVELLTRSVCECVRGVCLDRTLSTCLMLVDDLRPTKGKRDAQAGDRLSLMRLGGFGDRIFLGSAGLCRAWEWMYDVGCHAEHKYFKACMNAPERSRISADVALASWSWMRVCAQAASLAEEWSQSVEYVLPHTVNMARLALLPRDHDDDVLDNATDAFVLPADVVLDLKNTALDVVGDLLRTLIDAHCISVLVHKYGAAKTADLERVLRPSRITIVAELLRLLLVVFPGGASTAAFSGVRGHRWLRCSKMSSRLRIVASPNNILGKRIRDSLRESELKRLDMWLGTLLTPSSSHKVATDSNVMMGALRRTALAMKPPLVTSAVMNRHRLSQLAYTVITDASLSTDAGSKIEAAIRQQPQWHDAIGVVHALIHDLRVPRRTIALSAFRAALDQVSAGATQTTSDHHMWALSLKLFWSAVDHTGLSSSQVMDSFVGPLISITAKCGRLTEARKYNEMWQRQQAAESSSAALGSEEFLIRKLRHSVSIKERDAPDRVLHFYKGASGPLHEDGGRWRRECGELFVAAVNNECRRGRWQYCLDLVNRSGLATEGVGSLAALVCLDHAPKPHYRSAVALQASVPPADWTPQHTFRVLRLLNKGRKWQHALAFASKNHHHCQLTDTAASVDTGVLVELIRACAVAGSQAEIATAAYEKLQHQRDPQQHGLVRTLYHRALTKDLLQ